MKSSKKLQISSRLSFVYINNQGRKWRMSVLVFSSDLGKTRYNFLVVFEENLQKLWVFSIRKFFFFFWAGLHFWRRCKQKIVSTRNVIANFLRPDSWQNFPHTRVAFFFFFEIYRVSSYIYVSTLSKNYLRRICTVPTSQTKKNWIKKKLCQYDCSL